MTWHVYLLRCGDGTLYCGIALDVEARLQQHRVGKGAKYTRGRAPLKVVYCEACATKSAALRRERAIKRLRREAKLRLCAP
jgi:predicted GIY-YIG superfamily endonuclease